MLNNYPKYYFSITFPTTQKKWSKKRFFLGPYSGVTPYGHSKCIDLFSPCTKRQKKLPE